MLVWIRCLINSRFVDVCDVCVATVMKQELEYQADDGLSIQTISLNNFRELLINFTKKYFSRFIICDSAIVEKNTSKMFFIFLGKGIIDPLLADILIIHSPTIYWQ